VEPRDRKTYRQGEVTRTLQESRNEELPEIPSPFVPDTQEPEGFDKTGDMREPQL
jgi:hypothetical protein